MNTPQNIKFLTFTALILVAAAEANAAVIISLVGDKDGFGLPGAPSVPADGTLWQDELGGSFFNDYRDAADLANAPFSDVWTADTNVTYVHSYTIPAGVTALTSTLSLQIAGIADYRGPWDVLLNDTLLGQITENTTTNGFQEVLLYDFAVPVGLLTGSDTIKLAIGDGDGYSINFSELVISGRSAAVPDSGSTLALFGSALFGLGFWKRRNQKA